VPQIGNRGQGTGDRRLAARESVVVRIGVLGLQGDYAKHVEMLERIGSVRPQIVRTPQEIEHCDGLIIPGGESTTVGKLMVRYGVDEAIRRRVAEGMAVYGTCMGMIMLAKEIEDSDQPCLGLMDITVRRNAFGRQVDSFECDLKIPAISNGVPVRAVFIRAPYVTEVRDGVKVLATLESGEIVLVQQGNCLAGAFHPELTDDTRVHEYFVSLAKPAIDVTLC
jgi:pyridoxal 5'-phosphate synthase pdxT subunit